MSKKVDAKDLDIDSDAINENAIKSTLNDEMLLFRQLERTAMSASQDESIFAANVRTLLTMIPKDKRDNIKNRSDEYTSLDEHWEFKKLCGVNMNPTNDPKLREQLGSPYKISQEVIDWHTLFEMIWESLEESGLVWKRENSTVETGSVDDKESKIKPTPVLSDTPTKEDEQPTIPSAITPKAKAKKMPTCGICSKYVAPDTGMHFKHVQIHLACLDRAKIEWANLDRGIRKNQ